ncbi:MAG: adenylate kinase [Alphaproteobacteria bacterium]|nr:adenylate kinase [Alphaproteobacteria bacterium]
MASGPRIAVIGNAGGGKSTLARDLAEKLHLPHLELDRILWRPDWTPAPLAAYESDHGNAIASDAWIIDGLGRRESIPDRLQRDTAIILIDMPIWMHFWLAAERQIAWNRDKDTLAHPPAGATAPPPTEALFRTIFEVDREWMPEIRVLVARERQRGKRVIEICNVDQLRRGTDSPQLLMLTRPE